MTQQRAIPSSFEALKAALPNIVKKYGNRAQAVIDEILWETDFRDYRSVEELDRDIGIRVGILNRIHEMTTPINGNFKFNYSSCTSRFSTPSNHWETRIMKLAKTPTSSATEALDDLFRHGAKLDCERSVAACILTGTADAFVLNESKEAFDAIFDHSELQLRHNKWDNATNLSGIPIMSQTMSEQNPLLPGDHFYFYNLPDYINLNHNGLASGEHAIYIGCNQFLSIAEVPMSYDETIRMLASTYDQHSDGFVNYLYEQLGTKKHRSWSTLFPKANASLLKVFFEGCKDDLVGYENELKEATGEKLSSSNLEAHLKKLIDYRKDSLFKKIKMHNTAQGNLFQRIDTPALLALSKKALNQRAEEKSQKSEKAEEISAHRMHSSFKAYSKPVSPKPTSIAPADLNTNWRRS